MPGIDSFDKNVTKYEQWFVEHPIAYVSELHAVQGLLPKSGSGIEIGVGTGRFAAPLGIKRGVEPSRSMADLARKRGIEVVPGIAGKLPFKDGEFDFALMVTTVCFLDDMDLAFREAHRVPKPGGQFIIGFIDRESPLGTEYRAQQGQSAFTRTRPLLRTRNRGAPHKGGFADFAFVRRSSGPGDMEEIDPVKEGHGEGSFVA
jgi:SAM-dependent methyltransferase